jgi:hypothetical protein
LCGSVCTFIQYMYMQIVMYTCDTYICVSSLCMYIYNVHIFTYSINMYMCIYILNIFIP